MFYKKLKELRKENKISQRTLADMLGITQQAVAKWETGRSTPDTDTLQKLSSIFKVSIDNLLGVEKSLDNAFTTAVNYFDIPIIGSGHAGYNSLAYNEAFGVVYANVLNP